MDLPTYTSIWRIEKRLYKLYDFRLPMPLPVGQITVFAVITIPYVMLLSGFGVPFDHSLIWLYVLPPAVLTWLVTRPVLEGKRLPELIRSQLRYLAEPKVWCRMAPLAERDAMLVTGRLWRLAPAAPGVMAAKAAKSPRAQRPAPRLAPRYVAPRPERAPAQPDGTAQPGGTAQRPRVTVVRGEPDPLPPAVERVLAGPAARAGSAPATQATRVSVVPGGYRPDRPDQLQRDRARAQLPIDGPARVVVLGCTVGAGQTVTALLAGEVLASVRDEDIAVLDLNPGPGSLAEHAMARPALSQAASLGPSRLVVLGPSADGPGAFADDHASDAERFELASAEHDLVLADPSTASVPKLLPLADQLVLVAPASEAAASAIGMTFEWLEAHGQAGLAAEAIMVINGVSRRSLPHVEQAERVCVGRCRAIIRVPWDDQMGSRGGASRARRAPGRGGATGRSHLAGQQWTGLLSPAAVAAYTAMAGVLVAALAAEEPVSR